MTKPIIAGVSVLRNSEFPTLKHDHHLLISVLTDIDTNAGTGGGGGGAVKPEAVEVSGGGGEGVTREAGYGGQPQASEHYWSVPQYPGVVTGASAAYGHGTNPGVTGSDGLQVR